MYPYNLFNYGLESFSYKYKVLPDGATMFTVDLPGKSKEDVELTLNDAEGRLELKVKDEHTYFIRLKKEEMVRAAKMVNGRLLITVTAPNKASVKIPIE